MKQNIVVFLFIISILFGTSYQQFRHFDITDPRGMNDSVSYIKMSQGNYSVNPVHKYRFIVPYLAGKLNNYVSKYIFEKNISIILSFYIINFIIISFSAYFLYLIFEFYNFKPLLNLVGLSIFLSSRVIVYTTATPLVDSLYIFAIVVIVYFMIKKDLLKLSLFAPFLLLTKETVLLFLFLPFFYSNTFRNTKYIISIIVSILFFIISRKYIDFISIISTSEYKNFLDVIIIHIHFMKNNIISLFSFRGIFNFIHGFSFFLLFAVYGAYLNYKYNFYKLPDLIFLFIFLISFGFALLSGNLGRMIFSAYIPIIIYSLIAFEYIMKEKS